MCIHLTKNSVHYPCLTSRYSQKTRIQSTASRNIQLWSRRFQKEKRKPYIGYVYISSIFISLLTMYIRHMNTIFSTRVVYPFRFTKHISGFAFFPIMCSLYTTTLWINFNKLLCSEHKKKCWLHGVGILTSFCWGQI